MAGNSWHRTKKLRYCHLYMQCIIYWFVRRCLMLGAYDRQYVWFLLKFGEQIGYEQLIKFRIWFWIFVDRTSERGNAIASVRLSVGASVCFH